MDGFEFSYPRYLEAKESVDERSLHAGVEQQFFDRLQSQESEPVRILEVGGGTGATLLRILERLQSGSIRSLRYELVEQRSENIARVEKRIREWAAGYEYSVTNEGDSIRLLRDVDGSSLKEAIIHLNQSDFFDLRQPSENRTFDAVVAQALLDQVDLTEAVKLLESLLKEGGVFYLPIHYDGLTGFEPTIDADLDYKITQVYNQSIPHPQSGRRLVRVLQQIGSRVIRAGSSDWIVFGTDEGYKNDEAYFLKCILLFIEDELLSNESVPDDLVSRWIDSRNEQIRNGELIYVAHQMDICAEKEP